MDVFLFVFSFTMLGLAVVLPRRKRHRLPAVGPIRGSTTSFAIPAVLALTLSGGLTIGVADKAYFIGFPAFWFIAIMGLALAVQAIYLLEKIRNASAPSIPALFERVGGKPLARVAGLLIVATWVGLTAAQFVAAGMIVSTLLGMSAPWATIMAASFLIFFALVRGPTPLSPLFSTGFVLLVLSLGGGLIWLLYKHPLNTAALQIKFFSDSFRLSDFIYYLLVVAGANLANPMMFEEIGRSKNRPSRIRHNLIASAAIMLVFAFILGIFGLWASASKFNPGGSGDPLNAMVGKAFPPWLGATILFSLLATILSTTARTLWTSAITFDHDGLSSPKELRTRALVGAIALAAALVALSTSDIVGLLLATYQNFTASLVPAILVLLLRQGKRRVRPKFLLASMLSGYFISFSANFLAPPFQRPLAFASIAVSTALCLASLRGPAEVTG